MDRVNVFPKMIGVDIGQNQKEGGKKYGGNGVPLKWKSQQHTNECALGAPK
jgi:hypothetical protein